MFTELVAMITGGPKGLVTQKYRIFLASEN